MAATYVQVQRDDFENWLFSHCPVFERVEGKQGVYAIPVSDDVLLYISTSIGREDQAVAKGRGACHMKLQGRHNGQCLNRKDLGQTRFNRTTGWKDNWAEGIDRMFAAYEKHSEFYDARGRETQPEYALRIQADIETIRHWSASSFFTKLYDQLTGGRWLTPKQLSCIEDARDFESPKPARNPVEQKRIEAAGKLRELADLRKDAWVAEFAESIKEQMERGRHLSPRQLQCFERNLTKYGITASSCQAA